jgi:hypothetical protein
MNEVTEELAGAREEGVADPAEGRGPSLKEWIRDHDQKWLFVVCYLGLAVVLSVFVSLFWLAAIGAIHFALEIFRQAHYRNGAWNVVAHALWETKLDIALIILALTLVLYVEVVMGILGLQSAGRAAAGSRAVARLAAWERNLRTALLTADEAARIAHAGVTFAKRARSGGEGEAEAQEAETPAASAPDLSGQSAWSGGWSLGDKVSVGLLVLGILLIIAAPYVTAYDWPSAMQALAHELRPFPS